ncbi:MAG: glycosyltransferase [Bacteroidota bacterium]
MHPFFDFLLYTLYVAVFIQSIYYVFIFSRFPKKSNKGSFHEKPKVSVIICAKNEAQNLYNNLPLVLSQNFPNFEVVLINDASSDNTLEVMEDFKKQHANIKIVDVKSVEAFWGNKKYALTLGIKAASSNYLLFTDADCWPVSNQWINQMCLSFRQDKEIILGFSPYKKIKGSFLNLLIRFETFLTALQYFSYANIGQPYMAVGRNFAYKKALFFEANGFINHIKLQSGDDDLFVNQMANKNNTSWCISSESFVESQPKASFREWINQKRRHISTSKFYKPRHKILLGLFYTSQLLFWMCMILLGLANHFWQMVLVVVMFRFCLQYLVYYQSAKKLGETDLLYLLPLTEFVLVIFQFFIFIINLIVRPKHWK